MNEMLKSSRTWPSILTMAVVQLKFDQKGKYSYSTIENINQSHKQPLIENNIAATNGHLDYSDSKIESQCPLNGAHKKDLITRKNVKSRSFTSNRTTGNGRPPNSFQNHNSNSSNCSTSPSKNGKVCLCELAFRDKRKRSESIKVDNWDYIYKEKSFRTELDLPDDERNAIPKSPTTNCDHGYLSGLGAQKLDTLFRHYYPESGFGWIIVTVSILIAIITHGFQLSAVFFLLPAQKRFKVSEVECLEIKQLFGYDPKFKWYCSGLVLLQVVSLFYLKDKSWQFLLVAAYCFGGVINHSLSLAVHEISHSLSFGHARPMANRFFGYFCNLPLGVPMSVSFKKYHLEHHRYQGDEVIDTDLPTLLEAKLFCTTFGKFCWVCLQPFFYLVRPLIVNPKPPNRHEIINAIIQIIFDAIITYCFGWRMVAYLITGTLLAMGLHPVAGHFISEHYMFAKGFETYSYYGPLNKITWNVGYHNEHHDFPSIPGSRLPLVRKIAPEFYDDLPQHNSWVKVLYDFIMDPSIGPYARIKRKTRGLVS